MAEQTLECEDTSRTVSWESSFLSGSSFSSLVWRRAEMSSCEAAGFTFSFFTDTSAVGPALGTTLAGTEAWMGVRFLVLSPSNQCSPDMEETSFELMNDNSSSVLLKFSVSLALLTSKNFESCAKLEPFLWLLLKVLMNLWITLVSDIHQAV